jgi:hypothetical protein
VRLACGVGVVTGCGMDVEAAQPQRKFAQRLECSDGVNQAWQRGRGRVVLPYE